MDAIGMMRIIAERTLEVEEEKELWMQSGW